MLRVVRAVVAQQSEDQTCELTHRQHQGPPMGVLAHFGILFGVKRPVRRAERYSRVRLSMTQRLPQMMNRHRTLGPDNPVPA